MSDTNIGQWIAACDRKIIEAFRDRLVAVAAARHAGDAALLSDAGEEKRARSLRREARTFSPAVSDEAVEVLHDVVVDLTKIELDLA